MSEKLLVPDIGEFEKVEVIELLVKVGNQISLNDPVVTIESDKSSVEVPSNYEGRIKKINIKVGDKIIVMQDTKMRHIGNAIEGEMREK